MPQIIVIADDLTGANATGVMLSRLGLNVELSLSATQRASSDVVVCSTASRALSTQEAYDCVHACAIRYYTPDARLYTKRIDSTLRGPVAAELSAIMDALGGERLCLITPAFPDAGRVVIEGELFVDGIPLHKTGAAKDPLARVESPVVVDVLRNTMHGAHTFSVETLSLSQIRGGALGETLRTLYDSGARYVSCDAQTNDDLAALAKAAVASGIALVSADPGPLTYQIAAHMFTAHRQEAHVILAVGSVTKLTAGQIDNVKAQLPVTQTVLSVRRLLSPNERDREIDKVLNQLLYADTEYILISLDTLAPENRLDFAAIAAAGGGTPDELAVSVNDALATVVRKLYDSGTVGAVFASGGDVALAVCRTFASEGISLLDEVMPLAAFGRLLGGNAQGLPIVTKGGLVGDEYAMLLCARYLSAAQKAGPAILPTYSPA